jgi:hypothetical protein
MREGDWIAMPGVPLITAGHTEAAADVEKDRAGAQCDDARATEEATGPGAENIRDDGAEDPLGETERAEATVIDVVAALTPAGPAATPEGDVVPAPDGNAPAAASAEENPAGDASETAHAVELEAILLARSPQPLRQLSLRSSPPKSRSEERWAVILLTDDTFSFGVVVVLDTNIRCLCAGSLGSACVESRRFE